jgi:hypothetical protein
MNTEYQIEQGCSDEYAELCALSTTGELSADEQRELEAHVTECEQCAALLAEYISLVRVTMPKIAAADSEKTHVESASDAAYQPRKMEAQLLAALHPEAVVEPVPATESAAATEPVTTIHLVSPEESSAARPHRPVISWRISAGIAAMLLVGVAAAFQLGRRSVVQQVAQTSGLSPAVLSPASLIPATITPAEKARLDADKAALQAKLDAAQAALALSDKQSADAAQHVAELTSAQTALQNKIDELTNQNQTSTASLTTVSQQRDGLQQQLAEATHSLELVRADLDHAQQARQGAVLRMASLENEVDGLRGTMAVTNRAASADEQFLAQDRDIRELMGARQLYIADVMDVQSDGERSKPFGRVFYTKGKSLVFYAFDLQGQPGYREAKAFQAWGKPDSATGKAVSLGIFYKDSDANKRWVLKSDNPEVLAQINSIFVTVEPKGGSARPTGKPFLEAYLHTLPPNHP